MQAAVNQESLQGGGVAPGWFFCGVKELKSSMALYSESRGNECGNRMETWLCHILVGLPGGTFYLRHILIIYNPDVVTLRATWACCMHQVRQMCLKAFCER